MSPRKVTSTEEWTFDNIKYVRRNYDDEASYTRFIDQDTGKTLWTSFKNGRGHEFLRNFPDGLLIYCNHNTMTRKEKNKEREVRYFRDGELRWAVLLSGDTQPQD